MLWQPSPRRLPGAHRAQPLSRFSGLAEARSSSVGDSVPGPRATGPGPARLGLDAAWQRGVTPSLARTRDSAFAPPAGDTRWTSIEAPDNYGLDPDLRQYFGPVWYRRSIRRPEGAFVDLTFGAVDYLADVVLDGVHLGRHEGYFAPFLLDLSDRLASGETADLLVRVQDPLEALRDRRLFTRHRKRWIKGVMNYHDSRPGGMPGSMTRGWTFELGQSSPTGGLVGPVALESSGPVRLDGVFVTPLDLSGRVHVCLLLANRTPVSLPAVAVLTLTTAAGEEVTSHVTLDVPAGAARVDLESTVADPVLWWDQSLPSRGGSALYALEVSILVDAAVSAARREAFGLRVAEFPDAPRWHYVLNGVPVFVRAVNYIPVQHWARLDDSFYARDFEIMAHAHLHSAGVHAHVQSPACYRAADRAGISLFQDFPLQWTYASGTQEDPTFVPRATAMAAEMACLLWNHPSVVYYAAHNEPIHALRELVAGGMAARGRDGSAILRVGLAAARHALERILLPMPAPDDPARDSGNRCLDRALVETLRTVDPTRFVHDASGRGHDTHDYSGTISGGAVYDVGALRAPFVSEYGSFPVSRRALGRHDGWATPWPPGPPQIADLCRQGLIAAEVLGAVGDCGRYKDLTAFAWALERKAAFVAKYQTQFFRIHRNDPYTGCRWHFFVNYWGYMGGGLLDVDRVPTLAYHAIADALRPRLVAPHLGHTVFPVRPLVVPVFAMNDTEQAWESTVAWRIERLAACDVIRGERSKHQSWLVPPVDGTYVLPVPEVETVVARGDLRVGCPPSTTVTLGEVRLGDVERAPGPYRVVVEWDGAGTVEQNDYTVLLAPEGWKAPPGLTRLEGSSFA